MAYNEKQIKDICLGFMDDTYHEYENSELSFSDFCMKLEWVIDTKVDDMIEDKISIDIIESVLDAMEDYSDVLLDIAMSIEEEN